MAKATQFESTPDSTTNESALYLNHTLKIMEKNHNQNNRKKRAAVEHKRVPLFKEVEITASRIRYTTTTKVQENHKKYNLNQKLDLHKSKQQYFDRYIIC